MRENIITLTFANDISSGTMYGDGFKKGRRSMYIPSSSSLKSIFSMDKPLLETGLTKSLI